MPEPDDPFENDPETEALVEAQTEAVAAKPVKVPDHAGFTYEQAVKAGEALRAASRGCPVRQVRYVLSRWAREWEHAAAGVADEDDLTIECMGSVTPGMQVPVTVRHGGDEVTERGTVVRAMIRDGQASLHIETPSDPKPRYENYAHTGSPVVVFK